MSRRWARSNVRYDFVMFGADLRLKLAAPATALVATAALVFAPAALVFAPAAGANPAEELTPAGIDAPACCAEVAAPPQELVAQNAPEPAAAPAVLAAPVAPAAPEAPEAQGSPEAVIAPASHVDQGRGSLPLGIAPERGLQVKTILVARSISAAFPQIRSMIGARPDSKPWHPNGLALDIMIPNPGSAAGIALGDAILAYAMSNAGRFGVQDVIWRGTYYTPGGGASGSGYGHYDHVHITTTGGGYPTGGEEYPAG